MRGTLGSGQASRGSLEPASALLGPLATTAPCLGRSPKANPSRSSGVRNESPTSCDCGGGPVSSWLALRGPAAAGRRSRQRAGPSGCSGRSGRQGHQSPTADRGCLAGDETKSPPRCGPRSSALLPLPPHSLALSLGFLFRCLSVTRLYGDHIRPLAPASRSLWLLLHRSIWRLCLQTPRQVNPDCT